MTKENKSNYYEVLDINLNANSESIRIAYIRAKQAYNRDSLATYSLFDPEESKRILEEIEEAYSVLSDSEKRRKYDESHGIVSSENIYDSYHRGNSAVNAFARDSYSEEPERPANVVESIREIKKDRDPAVANLSPIERLKSQVNTPASFNPLRPYAVQKSGNNDPEMEEKIKKAEDVNGAWLRTVREYKGVSVDEMVDILKISRNYLTALEADDISKLPATVFVRGFVIQYARALKLDQEKVTASYMGFLRSKRPA